MRLGMATPRSALAVAAHPDDAEFGCGGTLARWAAEGCVVHHLVLTDGSKGSWDAHTDTAELVATRQDEQRAAAKALGATGDVRFLGRVDGELETGVAERRAVVSVLRELRPEAVLGHDPWRRYRLHTDHRNAGWLVGDAIVAARDPHFFPDIGPSPWRPSWLLFWEADEPDVAIDVSAYVDAKLDALEAHVSQFRSTMAIADPASTAERDRFRRRVLDGLGTWGRQVGVRHAEVFRLLDEL
ncbi:MAG: PIG-L deacetylase family protein [Acidimicrobiales bacterium]